MPQATRRWISEKVKSLNESNVLPFHDILDAKMVNAALASAGVTFKERIYTPFVTLCMFLSQVLDPDHSCRAAVARLIVWLVVNDREPCSPDTNSYSDARQRLPLEVIVELVHQTARKIEAGASDKWLWKGRLGPSRKSAPFLSIRRAPPRTSVSLSRSSRFAQKSFPSLSPSPRALCMH
jgi:hypothetical protein